METKQDPSNEQALAQSTEDKNNSEPADTVGVQLKAAREAQRLTIDEVAERLCFTPARVRELEANDFHSSISAKAYARGYVRGYAKLLKMDVEAILAQFDQIQFPDEERARPDHVVIRREPGAAIGHLKVFTIGVGVFFMVLVGLWWHSVHDKRSAEQTSISHVETELPLQPVNSPSNSVN